MLAFETCRWPQGKKHANKKQEYCGTCVRRPHHSRKTQYAIHKSGFTLVSGFLLMKLNLILEVVFHFAEQ
jgi:hypothetical protein